MELPAPGADLLSCLSAAQASGTLTEERPARPQTVTKRDRSRKGYLLGVPRSVLRDLALNCLPGLFAGFQIAGLLFFLNPELPFGWFVLLRTGLTVGLGCALASTALLTLFTRGIGSRAPRLLPWAITAVLCLSAVSAWYHASHLGFFLPPGVNVRLLKAAVGLSIFFLAGFYTCLLHSSRLRPYGRRSMLLFLLLPLASIYLLGERREAYRARTPAAPLSSAVEFEPRLNLLVVGLSGATLDAILPLAEQGQLPFFAHLMEQGAYARLTSFPPASPAALWTSVATGNYPYRHGIWGDTAFQLPWLFGERTLRALPGGPQRRDPSLPGVRDTATHRGLRRQRALWEILDRIGLPAGVVGWPATYPVERQSTFAFSQRYFHGDFSAAAALPPELAERGVLFQVGSDELDPELVAEFGDEIPLDVLRALASDIWRESLTLLLLDQRQETRAAFLLLPGLEQVSRQTFAGYAAVQLEGRQDEESVHSAHVLTAYYKHLDGFLREAWERPPAGKFFAVVSPYGVAAPSGWRRVARDVLGKPQEGTVHPVSDGVLFMLGEGVRKNTFLDEAGILDVLPTLLYGVGGPVSRELDGQVLVSGFDNAYLAQNPLTFVPSYETLARQGPSPEADDASLENSETPSVATEEE